MQPRRQVWLRHLSDTQACVGSIPTEATRIPSGRGVWFISAGLEPAVRRFKSDPLDQIRIRVLSLVDSIRLLSERRNTTAGSNPAGSTKYEAQES